jgi:hypothetical protein
MCELVCCELWPATRRHGLYTTPGCISNKPVEQGGAGLFDEVTSKVVGELSTLEDDGVSERGELPGCEFAMNDKGYNRPSTGINWGSKIGITGAVSRIITISC